MLNAIAGCIHKDQDRDVSHHGGVGLPHLGSSSSSGREHSQIEGGDHQQTSVRSQFQLVGGGDGSRHLGTNGGVGAMDEGGAGWEGGLVAELDDRTRAELEGVLLASLEDHDHDLIHPLDKDTIRPHPLRCSEKLRVTSRVTSSTNVTTSSSSNTTRTSSQISSPARTVPSSHDVVDEPYSRKKPTIEVDSNSLGGVDYEGVVHRLRQSNSSGMLAAGMLPFSSTTTTAPTSSSSSSTRSSLPPSPPLSMPSTPPATATVPFFNPPKVTTAPAIVSSVDRQGNCVGNITATTTTDSAEIAATWRVCNPRNEQSGSGSRDVTDGNPAH